MFTYKYPMYGMLLACLLVSACDMNIFRKKMPDAQTFFDELRALALAQAIERGDIETIRGSGSKLDINQPHGRGMTFLNWAFAHLEYKSAEALVALNANPHAETEGSSPFSLSMHLDDVRWLKLLVESGADINAKDGGSPVWFSVIYSNNWSHLDYLIEKGVDVNASNEVGGTAIMSLAGLEEYGQVLKLINKGADIQVTTPGYASFAYDVYSSPVESDHSEYANREKVIELLAQKGIHFPVLSPKEIRDQKAKESK